MGQMEWDRNGLEWDRTGRRGQTGPATALGPLWSTEWLFRESMTGHSSGTAQLLNPSKAAWILHGECQDSASSRAQAGNNDGVDSGDSQPHASASTFPSIHGVVVSSLFLFWQLFLTFPVAPSCSGRDSTLELGKGGFGAPGDILSQPWPWGCSHQLQHLLHGHILPQVQDVGQVWTHSCMSIGMQGCMDTWI